VCSLCCCCELPDFFHTLLLTPPLHPPLQIKDDWQAYTAALAPLLTAFGPYASQLSDLIVHLAKVSGVSRW
jgi:hypothetical protein